MADSVDDFTSEMHEEPALEPARGVRDLWQVPAAAIGAVLMLTGMYSAWTARPRADVDAMIDRAEASIQRGEYQIGLDILNNEVRAHTGDPALFDRDAESAFHLLRARGLYLAQRQRGIDEASNHERILTEYERAERQLEALPPEDVVRVGETLLSLGRFADAAARAASLPESHAADRIALRRSLIEAHLDGDEEESRALSALTELSLDPSLTPDDAAWVAAREAELRIERGFFDDTIARLLRLLPTLGDAEAWRRAELLVLLGEAYELTGDPVRAEEQLRRAKELLPESEPIMARVLLAEARIMHGRGEHDDARALLERVLQNYASTGSYLPGLLLLAQVEAVEDNHAESAMLYHRAIDEFDSLPDVQRLPISDIAEEIEDRAEERLDSGSPSESLRYAELAESLTPGELSSTRLLRLLASANRAMAEQIASGAITADVGLLDLADVDPVTRNTAREHFLRTARYARALGDRLVITDNASYADTLWDAAQAYDLAGDQSQAVATLGEFVSGFPDHQRRAEGRFRLARAHLSRGEYAMAESLYEGLIADAQDTETGKGVGPFASRSYVPLARAYMLDADESNDENAEQLLLRVLRGSLGGSDNPVYLEALEAVAGLYYEQGRLPEAIERLKEAIDRSPERSRVHALRYRLADALRRESDGIERTLDGSVPDTLREELKSTRAGHLREASELFGAVRDEIDSIDPRRRRPIDEVYLRNAQFYRADCLFDLGEHESAIQAYSETQRRYPDDPASLVAYMQVFNAYVAIGEFEKARTAQARAKKFYESLDPGVWDDPLLPLSRQDWERWLDATHALARAEAGGP